MAATSTKVENSVVQAMRIIADQRIENLKLDKTVRAVVDRHLQDNQYSLIYNGGLMYAYAESGLEFTPGASVYVLVPQGNFDERKRILGRTSLSNKDYNVHVVGSLMDGYGVLGNNLIKMKESTVNKYNSSYPFGLNSYRVNPIDSTTNTILSEYQELKVLYDANDLQNSWLDINTTDLETYIAKSKGFMLAAYFNTILPSQQIQNGSAGNYGLAITIKINNPSAQYATMQEEWDALEPLTKLEIDGNIKRLDNFKNAIRNISVNNINLIAYQQNISVIVDDLESFILAAAGHIDNKALQLCNRYYAFLSEDLITYTKDNNGNDLTAERLKAIHDSWFTEATINSQYQTVTYQYTLDTTTMIGDPYNFKQKSYQYIIHDLDTENFAGIERIYFFCQDFKPQNNGTTINIQTNDIFVSDIQFYCLEEIDEEVGDYKLELSFPQGQIFKTNEASETLPVNCKVIYQKYQDITTRCTATWFKQNISITDSSQSEYNSWAGAGWQQLSGYNNSYTFNAKQCGSYENEFLCLITSNLDFVVKKQFTLFNQANQRNIEIVSNSGTSFGFGSNGKILTCMIDNHASNFSPLLADNHYRFIWSKIVNNQEYVFTKTQEELEAEINASNNINVRTQLKNQLAQIKDIVINENVLTFPSTQIDAKTPVTIKCTVEVTDSLSNISYYKIGEAQITLSQVSAATLKGYYIEIENGSQVFQYNEAGISPCSERYEQPYEPLPLSCKFYSPGGGLISENKYKVRWQWPNTNTLLLIDKNTAVENPDTQQQDLYIQSTCPINIVEDYNYDAVNNQILCIVDFEGMTYTETTNFYFGKIGENGTNGTDIVAKIIPFAESTNTALLKEPLTLRINDTNQNNITYTWNTGTALTDPILQLVLYKRNVLVPSADYKLVKWEIAGTNASNKSKMSVQSSVAENGTDAIAIINYDNSINGKHNYIVKGQAGLSVKDNHNKTVTQKYYYYYPIPIIIQHKTIENIGYSISIDKDKTLRQVLYNKDGRSPQYNKNLGVKINFESEEPITKRTLKWTAIGGTSNTASGSALRLYNATTKKDTIGTYKTYYRSDSEVQRLINNYKTQRQTAENTWNTVANNAQIAWSAADDAGDEEAKAAALETYQAGLETYNQKIASIESNLASLTFGAEAFVKVNPVDVYSGAYSNNCVKVDIGIETTVNGETSFDSEYTVIVPIHLSLNAYGLASLNGWDGNSVEINEDKKYVLAPQVGAGIKNVEDNTFTGILIGQEETYDEANSTVSNIGLLGYSHGKQSIFLDAETGNATFGLPEDDALDAGNPLTEGRVMLRPGGTSVISKWHFDARSLYRVASKAETAALNGNNNYSVTDFDKNAVYTASDSGHNDNYNKLVAPYKKFDTGYVDNFGNAIFSTPAPKGAHGSIPHDQQGILLSGAPSYISVKGRPLVGNPDGSGDIDITDPDTIVSNGDSFEVEIDPNGESLFTIYAHMKDDTGQKWCRIPRVGINNKGRFFTNALRDGGTEFVMGTIGAFGKNATANQYQGISVTFDTESYGHLIRFFSKKSELITDGKKAPLYISGSADITSNGDEGLRPIGIYGGDYINLYAGDNNNSPTPSVISAIKINHKSGDNKIQLITRTNANDDTERAELLLNQNSSGLLYHKKGWTTTIGGNYIGTFSGTYEKTSTGVSTQYFDGDSTDHYSLIDYLNNGFYAEINKNTASGGKICVKYDGYSENNTLKYKQELLVEPHSLQYTQDSINTFEIHSTNGLLLKHLNTGKIVIKQDSRSDPNAAYADSDSQYTNAKLQLASLGSSNGLSIYTQDSSNSVGFKMIPGTNGVFSLRASGTALSNDVASSKGAYINSYYSNNEDFGNSATLPFFGVQIGPKLHTRALVVDHKLKPAAEATDVLYNMGLYVKHGIKTSADIKAEGGISAAGTIIGTVDVQGGGKSLKDHTHSFSKGVTVNVYDGPTYDRNNGAVEVTQGGTNSNATMDVYAKAALGGNGAWANAWNGDITGVHLSIGWRDATDGEAHDVNITLTPGGSYNNASLGVYLTRIDQDSPSYNYGCGHYAYVVKQEGYSRSINGESSKPS